MNVVIEKVPRHLCLPLLRAQHPAILYPLQNVLAVLLFVRVRVVVVLRQRTLSSLSLLTTTLEAAMGIGTDWPLLFSRTTVDLISMSIGQAGDCRERTAIDVENVFQAVDGGDLALASLECAARDHDLVLAWFSFCRDGNTGGSWRRTSFRTGMLFTSAATLEDGN
jgi:hypothetical protein